MSKSIDDHIIDKVKAYRKQRLFFTEDFVAVANAKAVGKALERLTESKYLIRVATGIYARHKTDTLVGDILPTTEQIAEAIAKRDQARIVPTGAYALNALGLSTQVPMNVVFLTDGSARKIKVGKRTILFKKTSPKNLAAKGNISKLVIQAMKTIGKDNVKDSEVEKILLLLKEENVEYLKYDIKLAPEWIRKIMKRALI